MDHHLTDETRRSSSSRTLATVVLAGAVVVALGACGSNGSGSSAISTGRTGASTSAAPSPSSSTTHNIVDTQFAQMMVVHHQGAVQMAQLAADRAVTYEVRALGKRIVSGQGPEIVRMNAWLSAWGEQPSSGSDGAANGSMPHSSMQVGGMEQSDATAELAGATGKDFDRQFLTLMMSHHQSALEMAKVEQAQGLNADAVELSGTIATSQTAEIDEMRAMMGRLGGS